LRIVMQGNLDQEGELEYTGAIHDVTQSRFAEKALGKLRSELAHLARVTSLGALAASIAHEVNQPLCGCITNVSTCLRMLDEDPLDIDGARETARLAIRDGRRASEVITRLRALFGKKAATTESVNLNEAAREVMALASGELRRNRVVVRTQLTENLPTVVGDGVQLQQVILNLILNALDAMAGIHDRPRRLVIRTELEPGDRVRLIVKDSGIGFQRQDLEQLFEAFYTTKRDGMGIGLSVSRSIIESHHGCLWGRPNEDVGATFCFSIPIAAAIARGSDPPWPSNLEGGLPVARNAE
jgi:C4-dicarboxylate-specific signal transduction histidine kinase